MKLSLPRTTPLALTVSGLLCALTLPDTHAARPRAREKHPEPPRPELQKTQPTSLWHVWRDPKGNTLEAELTGVDGDRVTVRTREGQSHRLNLTLLVDADREFAQKAQRLLPSQTVPVAEAAAQIDARVRRALQAAGQSPNPPLSEEAFARRVYLDVAGRIPTPDELVAHLQNPAPDRRAQLIDSLLASEGYQSQMFNWFADMLRLRDDFGRGVKSFVYQEWIKEQIAANRHWDTLVYELMTAEGRIASNGPVGYLLRDRGMPLDNLSNTLTTFLGANVACAQCHDHPLASWTERNFYEMAAYFGSTDQSDRKRNEFVKWVPDKKFAIPLSSLNARVETLPRITTTFPKDYKYEDAKPGDPVRPRLITWESGDEKNPAYVGAQTERPEEARERFAVWLTHPENPRFATAIANRLWKKLFGLAVQEPITDLDDPKLASNPELLAHLAGEMRRVHFDLREFQRILLNTATYQAQASQTPDPEAGPYLFPGPLLRRMSGEQAWDSLLTLAVGTGLDSFKLRRADQIRPWDLGSNRPTKEMVLAKVAELTGDTEKKGRTKLSKNAGVNASDFEGNPPPRLEGLLLARASELPQPSKESHFLRNFGQSDRLLADSNSSEGGVPQILMMMNGDVQKVVTGPSSAVLKAAERFPKREDQIRHLYLGFLGRAPTPDDLRVTSEMLAEGRTLRDLAWAFLNTREFLFIQ